jgi:multidrug efflux pump subunit AcrB
LILGYGIYSYFVIPKQEMPTFDSSNMVITIIAPGVNAKDIEDEIVSDIEKLILTYGDVDSVRSIIYDNYCVVLVMFKYSADNSTALGVEIFDKINELSLNDNISDISYNSDFEDPHIIFAVHSDTLSDEALLSYSESFKNDLLLIDEIKKVEIDSVFDKEIVITLDTTLLDLYGLTLTDIYGILYANSINIPLGGLSTIYGTISISSDSMINDISELENMIIIPEIVGFSPQVLLSDVGTVELVDTNEKIYEFDNEKAIFLSIYFQKDIDFTKMGDEIIETKEAYLLEESNNELEISEMLFLPDYVNKQINDVFYSLLAAIVIVMIVVLIGIGFRNSLLIIITIPLVIFTTVGILYLSNYELHKLTIVGLIVSIGILVDNSIVITEGIKRNLDNGLSKIDSAKKAIFDNSIPVLSSTLTTIAAFIVLVLLPGFLGEVVSSMPLTVIIAISLSYIVSMILSPVIATIFLKKTPVEKVKKTTVHERNIRKMIGVTVKYPLLWIGLSITMLVGSVYFAFDRQELDLYPNDERSVLYIDFENNTLGDMWSTNSLKNEITDILDDNNHVSYYSSSVGGSLPNFHFSAKYINERPHVGRIYVDFDYDEKELLEYKTELEIELKKIDAALITVNLLELSPPIPPLHITLKSDDISELDTVSSDIFAEIINLDSVKTYNITQNIKSPKYIITYDHEKISNHFLTKAQIDEVIAINLNGLDLNVFSYNNETINISINSDVTIVEDLLDLNVYSSILDSNFPLSTFISIETVIDYSVINRLDNTGVNIIDLYFSDDASLGELEKDVKEIVDNYELGDVSIHYGGENEMFEEISGDLIRASVIALIMIYIIMFIQFNSFIKPLIVYLTIPLSFTGSFLFLIIFNSPITATSLVGMVSLIGITVNTGILLVEYITRNHNNGSDIKQACIDAVYLRFRPIMLTSLTTILGLIPLLITGGNFFRPLAITFMGGIVTSTVLTLFLVPSVYYMIYKKRVSNKKVSE